MGPSHGGLGPITNGPDNFTFHELGGDPMPRVFYATMAQVLPVLFLAPVWESRYLETCRTRNGGRGATIPATARDTHPAPRRHR